MKALERVLYVGKLKRGNGGERAGGTFLTAVLTAVLTAFLARTLDQGLHAADWPNMQADRDKCERHQGWSGQRCMHEATASRWIEVPVQGPWMEGGLIARQDERQAEARAELQA